jgi:predicted nucleic acid-binding Zn ribbon protein
MNFPLDPAAKVETIRVSIDSLEFDVLLKKSWQVGGIKAKLRLDADSLTLSEIQFQKGTKINVPWGRIRGLQTRDLLEKKAFIVDLGPPKESVFYPIVVKNGPFAQLVEAFGKLPESARLKKCTACGGPIREGTCEHCGAHLSTNRRVKGLRTMFIGLVSAALGGILTISSFKSAKPGGVFFIFTGLLVFGVVYTFIGLFNFIFAKDIK